MNCRTRHKHRYSLLWDVSDSSKATVLDSFQAPELIDPNCQGSVLHSPATGKLYLSNPNSTSARKRMTVKTASDPEGRHWSEGKLVYAGGSGYSQLTSWITGEDRTQEGCPKLGLLFERHD